MIAAWAFSLLVKRFRSTRSTSSLFFTRAPPSRQGTANLPDDTRGIEPVKSQHLGPCSLGDRIIRKSHISNDARNIPFHQPLCDRGAEAAVADIVLDRHHASGLFRQPADGYGVERFHESGMQN